MNYKDYIEVNPMIRFGKPCIRGTRISFADVLGWLASGKTIEEINGKKGENAAMAAVHPAAFS